MQSVFLVDSLLTSDPMTGKEEEIYTPIDISNKFDSITYSKGKISLL